MNDSAIAILRVIHIAFGSVWLGGAMTLGFFVLPAATRAEPGSSAQPMAHARALGIITGGGAIAMIAGFVLYGAVWTGAGSAGPARLYAIGGHFATAAIAVTAVLAGPAAFRLGSLAHALARQNSPPTEEQRTTQARLVTHLAWASRLAALLLVVTVAFMAIGRYV